MAEHAHLQTLFAYHWDATERLIAKAEALSAEEYMAHPGVGHGSLHALFFHVLRADSNWRQLLATGQPPVSPVATDFPTLAAIRAGFAEERQAWDLLLESLDEAQIDAAVQVVDRDGDVSDLPRWNALFHVLFHGMQHHAELAQLLTAKGQSPGDIDLIFYL